MIAWEVAPKSTCNYTYAEKYVSMLDWCKMSIPDPGRYVLHPVGIHSKTNEVFYIGGDYGREFDFYADDVKRIGVRIVDIQSRYDDDLKRSYRDVCSNPSSATVKAFLRLLLVYCNSYEQPRGEYEVISISKDKSYTTRITVRDKLLFVERLTDGGRHILGKKLSVFALDGIVDNASTFIVRPSRDPCIYQNVSNAESLHKLVSSSEATDETLRKLMAATNDGLK